MALFGNTKVGKVKVNFGMSSASKSINEPTLLEMAEEKFGKDKRLMLEIDLFLAQRRKAKQNPSRIAWASQLQLLEKFPQEDRLDQVMRSIRNDYKCLAYESRLPEKKPAYSDVNMEKSREEDICYDEAF